jgi:signal transduction histidine kinase
MSDLTPRPGLPLWHQQRHPALAAIPYVLLALLTVFTLPWHAHPNQAENHELPLCAFAAAWMLFMHTMHPGWRQRALPMAIFTWVLIVTNALLVVQNGWFGFFLIVTYPYAVTLLRWPGSLAAVVMIAFVAAFSQVGVHHGSILADVLLFSFALAIDIMFMTSLAWFLRRNEQQDEERGRVVAELTAANQRLEATIEENESLHRQLLVQAREAGTLDERRRMAREIHDTLAQGLTGIVTQLQAAEQAADDPARWRRHLTAATRLAREGLTEARRSVHALRPEPLEHGRLGEALAGVAERWSALHGIPVQVTTTGAVRPIQPEAEFALLRAAQEALANVARHARATRVGLTVSYMESEVALDVRDDGVGFDATRLDPAQPAQPGRGGFGLVAMRQRIEGLAGTLQVESEPGGGTAISACVPTVPALAGS